MCTYPHVSQVADRDVASQMWESGYASRRRSRVISRTQNFVPSPHARQVNGRLRTVTLIGSACPGEAPTA